MSYSKCYNYTLFLSSFYIFSCLFLASHPPSIASGATLSTVTAPGDSTHPSGISGDDFHWEMIGVVSQFAVAKIYAGFKMSNLTPDHDRKQTDAKMK